jgi:protoheme ferro-lyase
MENVTAGRNIPRERLEEVSQHYHEFGGRSPINDQNRDLIAALESLLAAEGPSCRCTSATATGTRCWPTPSGRCATTASSAPSAS